MAEQGYIVISDITGYTAFLSESELEHAEDSLRSLLNLLLEHTKPPLVVSRLEGDAVISYALNGSFSQGQTLVEMLEGTYVAYRRALQQMVLNTTCTCNACRNIPSLDLKFFVHYGTFMLQDLASYTELIGSDVNLVHRLTKNSITEVTGLRGYGVYTEAAVEALGIGDLCGRMVQHKESYEHLGEVSVYVQDMQAVWERERTTARVVVDPDDALLTIEEDFPVGQPLLWDYLTKPEYRAAISGSKSAEVTGRTDGRIGVGAAYYCAHGRFVSQQTVVDWQPFEQYTTEMPGWGGVSSRCTIRLSRTEKGTRAQLLFGRSRGHLVLRIIDDLFTRLHAPRTITRGLGTVRQAIEEATAAGAIGPHLAAEIPPERIEEAVAESLPSRSG